MQTEAQTIVSIDSSNKFIMDRGQKFDLNHS